MKKERWRDVPDYVGYYQASDRGRVRSLDRTAKHGYGGTKNLKGQFLKPAPAKSYGHLVVVLCKNGACRSVYVHQLVMLAFVGTCPPGEQIRHGPNGLLDNSVGNLCYGTPAQDYLDRIRDGTSNNRAVRRSDGKEFISLAEAAKETCCDSSCISKICKGQTGYKTSGGYGWEYI